MKSIQGDKKTNQTRFEILINSNVIETNTVNNYTICVGMVLIRAQVEDSVKIYVLISSAHHAGQLELESNLIDVR